MSDPYTLIHNAIWTALEANAAFTALVPVSNRIKFSGDNRNPIKDRLSSADTPDVRVIVKGLAIAADRASNAEFDRLDFSIDVASGDQRITEVLFPLCWAIRKVVYSLDTALATALSAGGFTGCSARVVADGTVAIGGAREGDDQGVVGWASVWSGGIEIAFSKATLTP